MLTAKAESHRSQMKRRDLNLIAFCLQSSLSLIGIFFRYLFVLTTFFFWQGKQVELSRWLLALVLRTCEKN